MYIKLKHTKTYDATYVGEPRIIFAPGVFVPLGSHPMYSLWAHQGSTLCFAEAVEDYDP